LVDDPVVNDDDPRATSLDELRDQYVRYYEQCEAVARSSILAAESNPRRRKHGAKSGVKPAAAGPAAGAPRRRRLRRRPKP